MRFDSCFRVVASKECQEAMPGTELCNEYIAFVLNAKFVKIWKTALFKAVMYVCMGNFIHPADKFSGAVLVTIPFNPRKLSGYYMYRQVSSIINSTFRPHSVFMCFVWISEETAIISLNSINWLVFMTEMEYVYCAVPTESLVII
jgi:hypothetical protein